MNLPQITWSLDDAPHTAHWHSERGMPAPQRVQLADDTLSADAAYRLASEGVGLLWCGDFQNARHLVQALDRRIQRHSARKQSKARPAAPKAAALTSAFHQQRQAQAQRARILGSVLIPLQADYSITLRRAPDAKLACEEAWGAAPKKAAAPSAAATHSVCSLRELLGIISAHEWHKKGVEIPQLGLDRAKLPLRIHPHYGVFSPVRGEYLALVAQAPLPAGDLSQLVAIDVGTGTGVLAAILAKRGIGTVLATELSPRALACARDNMSRLQAAGLKQAAHVKVIEADLFPDTALFEKANLIVCNPPWLPGRPSSTLEQAVYDEGNQMLLAFLRGAAQRLALGGEAWLILSDFAELLGLRSRDELQAAILAAGLKVIARLDTTPKHPKSRDDTDPLFAARSKETTSLWRLASA